MSEQTALELLKKLARAAEDGIMACNPTIMFQSLRQGGTDPVSPENRTKLTTFWEVLAETNDYLQANDN